MKWTHKATRAIIIRQQDKHTYIEVPKRYYIRLGRLNKREGKVYSLLTRLYKKSYDYVTQGTY